MAVVQLRTELKGNIWGQHTKKENAVNKKKLMKYEVKMLMRWARGRQRISDSYCTLCALSQSVRCRWTERQNGDRFDRSGDQSSWRIGESCLSSFMLEEFDLSEWGLITGGQYSSALLFYPEATHLSIHPPILASLLSCGWSVAMEWNWHQNYSRTFHLVKLRINQWGEG